MATAVIRDVLHTYDWTGQQVSSSTEASKNSPTLVFIHGWLLSRSYWEPVIKQLSEFYPCLSYDLRGFGESAATCKEINRYPSQGFTLEDYAKDLQVLLAQLGITNAWLVGHSLGGSIAICGASNLAEVVQGVVCVNSGGGIYLKEDFEKFRSAGQKLIQNRFPWLMYVPFIELPFTRLMVQQPLSRRWGKQRLLDFFAADRKAALGALLETTTEKEVHQLPQLVAQLQQPVYFLAGSQDSVMELKYVYHLASFHHLFGLRGENVTEIQNCGHLAMVEHAEIVSQHLIDILSKNTCKKSL
ncbi:alpha/beta hydrolase fold protein [[Leptolyngbya] sp. PCC 7376]|uniref:alpha/beta fold hydrolase n=1 Tax=[Leptolyngbya] sp. PCC 7376 TaxID=111781 RepID=UPI00029F25FF|nr:alpha/beta hydrolase [[Leptolyngbya] sp. PCC 7376]AFY39124.1 alpha/beta hydrolase fold protein [[Leptolyngbya] sp. PCC 7376]